MSSPITAEFIRLPTETLVRQTIKRLMALSVDIPRIDKFVDLTIECINAHMETKIPLGVIVEHHFEFEPFDNPNDQHIMIEVVCYFSENLMILCDVLDVLTPGGLPYRFWSMLHDDLILQHRTSTICRPTDRDPRTVVSNDLPASFS